MSSLSKDVIAVFEAQVANLAVRSKETDQETRISAYTFANDVKPVIYDKDVLRLPSIKDDYHVGGMTALISATLKAIDDLEKTATLYGDHSFLVIVVTDGGNNMNNELSSTLEKKLKSLPENWTVAVLVPDAMCASEAKKFGFQSGNIQIWDTSSKGIAEAGKVLTKVTDNYMAARATGVRGTKTLFQLDTKNLNSQKVLDNMDALDPKTFEVLIVRKDGIAIKDHVESWGHAYNPGSGYYELTKPEKVQANKQIIVQNKISGKYYSGLAGRKLLGLPDYEVKVTPTDFKNYRVYVQSSSVNRKLVVGTNLVYFK
jgi:hypothetical protein